jgi:uncharacterized membrane protein
LDCASYLVLWGHMTLMLNWFILITTVLFSVVDVLVGFVCKTQSDVGNASYCGYVS